MTISFGAAGASSSAAESVTPALPAGASAGMLAVLQVVSGHQDDPVPATPSGWTFAGSASGGGGAFGAAAGPRRLTFFVRELVASDTAPTVSIPTGGTGSTIAARIYSFTRSAGTGWRWAYAFGEDTSSGTGFSAASSTALTWVAGDTAVIGYGIPLSTASFSAEAITASGITFGTITERADDAITAGHDSRFVTATGAVSSGSGTQAPTLAATLSSASTGVAGVLRLREAGTDMEAFPQTVFPPRNLISATGLLADNIASVGLYRQVGDTLTPVRAAVDVDVSGSDVLLRVDAEQPFGVAHEYLAVLTDVNGLQWTIYSSTITSTVDSDVISDAVRGIGAAVRIETPLEWQRTRDATKFNAGGRIIVVGKTRSAPSTTMTVRTETDAAGDALNAVLADLTEGVLLFRKQDSLSRLDGYYALSDDTESPNWYDSYRWFQLEVQQTEAWPSVLEAAGFTLQDIADNYSSLQDIAGDFTPGDLLDIALFDFGA
ncbi:hypothetical protein [Streptomyces antibioticus]|uniref:hypothetical protein n=1 Tax=Streptomyces antibioticus TaxID=1890 RepID=UPI0036CE3CD1